MATRMTVNGISTTQKGQEQYETFCINRRTRKKAVQYDYRDLDGELFSCVRPTLKECRGQRDIWLMKKTQQMD